jgi:hypothetical protein
MIEIKNSNKTVDTSAYNCLGILLATAAVQLGVFYQMMARGGWVFDFDSSLEGTIGNKLSCKQRHDFMESFEKYHEVVAQKHELNRPTFITKVAEWLSDNTPVIINTDSFWCPWSFAYHKRNYLHSFMITGVNATTNMLICRDPYITEKILYASLDDIYPGVRHCFTIHKKPNPIEPSLILSALKEDVEQLLNDGDSMFDNLHIFGERLDCMNISVECKGFEDSLYAVPLFEKLKSVTCSRRGYSYMIQYIAYLLNDSHVSDLSERLFKISTIWEEIRGRLIRHYLRGKYEGLHLLSREIHQIAEDELSIAVSLSMVLNKKYF